MKSKKAVKKGVKPARPLPAKFSASAVSFAFSLKAESLEAVLGAAYLMMDRAYAVLSMAGKGRVGVSLKPKAAPTRKSLEALAETFLSELASQKVRWAIAKNNLPIREYIAEQAVLLVNGAVAPAPAQPQAEQLTDDQRLEIEKLIAEVELEIKTMNDKKAGSDPKNIKASWEEKQESKGSR